MVTAQQSLSSRDQREWSHPPILSIRGNRSLWSRLSNRFRAATRGSGRIRRFSRSAGTAPFGHGSAIAFEPRPEGVGASADSLDPREPLPLVTAQQSFPSRDQREWSHPPILSIRGNRSLWSRLSNRFRAATRGSGRIRRFSRSAGTAPFGHGSAIVFEPRPEGVGASADSLDPREPLPLVTAQQSLSSRDQREWAHPPILSIRGNRSLWSRLSNRFRAATRGSGRIRRFSRSAGTAPFGHGSAIVSEPRPEGVGASADSLDPREPLPLVTAQQSFPSRDQREWAHPPILSIRGNRSLWSRLSNRFRAATRGSGRIRRFSRSAGTAPFGHGSAIVSEPRPEGVGASADSLDPREPLPLVTAQQSLSSRDQREWAHPPILVPLNTVTGDPSARNAESGL